MHRTEVNLLKTEALASFKSRRRDIRHWLGRERPVPVSRRKKSNSCTLPCFCGRGPLSYHPVKQGNRKLAYSVLGISGVAAIVAAIAPEYAPYAAVAASTVSADFKSAAINIVTTLFDKHRDSLPPSAEELFANHDLTQLIADAIAHSIQHPTFQQSATDSGVSAKAITSLAAAARDYYLAKGESLDEVFAAIQVSQLTDTISRYATAVGEKPHPEQGNTLTPDEWRTFLDKIDPSDHSTDSQNLLQWAAPALYKYFAQACYECAKTDFEKKGKAYAGLQLRLLSSLAAGQREILGSLIAGHRQIVGKIEGIEKSQSDILTLLTQLLQTFIQHIGQNPTPALGQLIALAKHEISQSHAILAQLDRMEGTLNTIAQDVRHLKQTKPATHIPWHPPVQAENLLGRDLQIRRFAQTLLERRVVVFHGPGGMGKTSLAAAVIAHIALSREQPGPWTGGIYSHDFYQQRSHDALIESLTLQSNITDIRDPEREKKVRHHFNDPTCLIYLEGCERAEELAKLWDLLPAASLCLTTRDYLHVDSHRPIMVRKLGDTAGAEVIQYHFSNGSTAPLPLQPSHWKTLAQRLGGHPLACERAGILLRLSGKHPAWLLTRMDEDGIQALGGEDREHKSVFYLLKQTAYALAAAEPQTLALWHILSLGALTPMSEEALAYTLEITDRELEKLFAILRAHSLITPLRIAPVDPALPETGWVLTHALLSEWAFQDLPDLCKSLSTAPLNGAALLARWQDWWHRLLFDGVNKEKLPGGEPRYRLLAPHLKVLPKRLLPGQDCVEEIQTAYHLLIDHLAGIHLLYGRYSLAEPLWRQATDLSERTLGPEHPHTLKSVNNLAEVLRAKGDLAAAAPLYRRALEARERILESDHPDTLVSVNNLAELLKARGDFAEAEHLYHRASEARYRILGPEHPDTLSSVNNLAALLRAKGDLAAAEPLYRRALEARERILKPEHPNALVSVNNLAELLKAKGDLAGAEPLYRRALEAQERTLGPEHPHTLVSVNNLAALLRAKGDLTGAEPLYRRALEAREGNLGPDHPNTLTSVNNLAALLRAKGDLAAAEPLYRRALEARNRTLKPEHPATCMSAYNLATFLVEQQRREEALPLARQAWQGWLLSKGESHEDTRDAAQLLHDLEGK